MMKKMAAFISGLMMITGACTGCAEARTAQPLGASVNTVQQTGQEPEMEYISAQYGFGTELFKRSAAMESGENVLISPFSVYTAMAMAGNGAEGQSLEEFETVLGNGMKVSDINEYTAGMINRLNAINDGTLNILNSVWIRDIPSFRVNQDFVNDIGSWYGAEAFMAAFDHNTIEQANKWVSDGTNGMIKKLLEDDDIDEDTRMMLINTLYFNCKWKESFEESRPSAFTSADGSETKPETLFGTENTYYEGKGYTGFAKPYNGGFSFVGLLPDEGTDIEDFIASLDAVELANTLANPVKGKNRDVRVFTSVPVLKLENRVELQGLLADMGFFNTMDSEKGGLSRIAAPDSAEKDFYISKVIHSAAIDLDAEGTEASASTAVIISRCEGVIEIDKYEDYYVYLDRPFVYMIVDDATGLPLFMGAVLDAAE